MFKNGLIFLVIMCVSVYRGNSGALRGHQKSADLLELELQVTVSHSMWVLETEPDPLEEQQML